LHILGFLAIGAKQAPRGAAQDNNAAWREPQKWPLYADNAKPLCFSWQLPSIKNIRIINTAGYRF
jgi:hypothetical protein